MKATFPVTTKRWPVFIRRMDAGEHVETFLIAAVTSILAIRLFLRIAGYPQLQAGPLHIAHMTWGGLMMLLALVILFSFLSKASTRLAAVLGGVGFGTFLDEIGKFVTRDNNYFFQPAIALIYITFILVFLLVRAIHTRRSYSRDEYLLNALREMEEYVLQNLDEEERTRVLALLEKSDPSNRLVKDLTTALQESELVPVRRPHWARAKTSLREAYHRIADLPEFSRVLVVLFSAKLVVNLVQASLLVASVGFGRVLSYDARWVRDVVIRMSNPTFADFAEIASSLFSGILVALALMALPRSRLMALRLFKRSVLVSIFLTQVFVFYREQFAALVGLLLNIMLLLALDYMIG